MTETRTNAEQKPTHKGRFKPGERPPVGRFFEKGNPGGPGAPKRRTLFSIVSEVAAREGKTVSDVVEGIYAKLIEAVNKGDVTAAKLLLERLTENDPLHVQLAAIELTATERASRIRALLATAKIENGLSDEARELLDG